MTTMREFHPEWNWKEADELWDNNQMEELRAAADFYDRKTAGLTNLPAPALEKPGVTCLDCGWMGLIEETFPSVSDDYALAHCPICYGGVSLLTADVCPRCNGAKLPKDQLCPGCVK